MLDSITQTTSLAAEWQIARKARLARFAEAAARLSERQTRPVLVNVERISPPEAAEIKSRREYTSSRHVSSYTPLAKKILWAVADEFGITVDDLRSANQTAAFTVPRHVAVGMMFEMTRLSIPAIGNWFFRDHTTAINSRRQAEKMFAEEAFRNRVDQMKAEILKPGFQVVSA